MTKRHGKMFRLYLDQFNVSGLASKFSRKLKVDTADVTNFGSAGNKEYLEGRYDWTGDWTGFFDTADDAWDEQSFAMLVAGGDRYCGQVVCAAVSGPAAGDLAYEDVCVFTDQPREFDIGNAVVLSGALQGVGGTARGDPGVNFAGAVTATGAETGIEHGATAAGQTCVVTYRVLSVTGAGTIAVALETSTDDGAGDAYAAVAALASGDMTGTGVVQKTTTDATEAWKRINVTTFAGFTSVTLLVTITVKA